MPVTGRRPHGVVAAVARRHRKRGMALTTTQAPRRRPARPPVELARGRPASGRDARRYCPEFPMMGSRGSPRRARTSLWRRPGAKTGRRPGARTTSPVRGREGWGCVPLGRGRATGHGQPRIRAPTRPALLPGRAVSGRTDRRLGRPIPFRPWHRIRAGLRIAESRPPGRLWVREPAPRGLGPGRQGAVPGTRSRPGRPWYRAGGGEGGVCRAVNMAHTTFPASLGVV